jgi:hypothetical protein
MGRAEREKDQFRRAKLRLRRIQHYETDHLQNPQASSRATRIRQALSPRASPPARARSCRPVCASRRQAPEAPRRPVPSVHRHRRGESLPRSQDLCAKLDPKRDARHYVVTHSPLAIAESTKGTAVFPLFGGCIRLKSD